MGKYIKDSVGKFGGWKRYYKNRRNGKISIGEIHLFSKVVVINNKKMSLNEAWSLYKPIDEDEYKDHIRRVDALKSSQANV